MENCSVTHGKQISSHSKKLNVEITYDRTILLLGTYPKEVRTVMHACNPRYSKGIDWGNQSSRPAKQKVSKTPISTNWAHACNSSCMRGIGRRIEASSRQK
jgi:hypothetical protein